jgi:hypothetical protein
MADMLVSGTGAGDPLRAIVSRSAATLERNRQRPLCVELTAGADMRGFLETAGEPHFPQSAEEYGNLYFCHGRGVFDQVILDDSIPAIRSPWSRVFYSHLYGLVRPGGRLILPLWTGPEIRRYGRWSAEDFANLFGAAPEPLGDSGFVAVTRGAEAPHPEGSILRWFIDHGLSILVQQAYFTANESDMQPDWRGMFTKTDPAALKGQGAGGVDDRFRNFTSQHSYYVGGIAYKQPLLAHIIRTYLEGRKGLNTIDMGGGYGLLAAELALDEDLGVARSVCTDISDLNARLAARMYADLVPALAGRFLFELGPAQTYVFDRSYDVVSYVGSLLYVPKNLLQATIERAWNAVAPGGILVVHENIKNPSYTRDYDVMFLTDEIDALMGRFGEVNRFASQYTQPLTKEQTGDKTVFRTVQKPA